MAEKDEGNMAAAMLVAPMLMGMFNPSNHSIFSKFQKLVGLMCVFLCTWFVLYGITNHMLDSTLLILILIYGICAYWMLSWSLEDNEEGFNIFKWLEVSERYQAKTALDPEDCASFFNGMEGRTET